MRFFAAHRRLRGENRRLDGAGFFNPPSRHGYHYQSQASFSQNIPDICATT
jgi:hypothetical protein